MPAETSSWGFVPGAPQPEIVRAEGCTLITREGRRILDAAGGAIVSNIGHGRSEVRDAVARAMADIDYVVPTFATPQRTALVDRLKRAWLPGRLSRVHLSSGGSEAADTALRLARLHFVARGEPERRKIIGRDVGYNGTTLATLGVGGHDARRAPFLPLIGEWPHAPTPYPLRHRERMGEGPCGAMCADALRTLIEREGPETIAAFLAEPIVGSSGGSILPPDDYWPRVQAICRAYGILIIADEVMVGFGRTGTRFAVEHWALDADILYAGKGLTAGYAPLVGVYATEEVVAPLAERGQTLMFFTYGGHSAACAAADTVLDIMEREALVERSAAMGLVLDRRLGALRQHPHVAEARGRGLFYSVEVVADRDSLTPFPLDAQVTQKIVAAALDDGVFFYPGGTGTVRDIIVMGPPFTISEAEIDRMVSVLERAIDRVTAREARRT